jgi:cytochrome P450
VSEIIRWQTPLPYLRRTARFARIEVHDEPERVFSTFVRGYSNLPVTVTRR